MAKKKSKPKVILEAASASAKAPKAKKPKWTRPDLRFKIGSQGVKIYEKKASQIGKAALKTLVKQANERLRQIEKRGLQAESKEYQLVKYYAEEKAATKGAIYNVGKDGRIRFSSDLQKFMNEGQVFRTAAERRAYFINTLRNFLTAETSTVSGIKAAKEKAFGTFKKNYGEEFSEARRKLNEQIREENKQLPPDQQREELPEQISKEDYFNFWKMYREVFSDTKADKYGYNTVRSMMDNSTLMALPPETIRQVMEYAESLRNVEDKSGFVEMTEDMFPDLQYF